MINLNLFKNIKYLIFSIKTPEDHHTFLKILENDFEKLEKLNLTNSSFDISSN